MCGCKGGIDTSGIFDLKIGTVTTIETVTTTGTVTTVGTVSTSGTVKKGIFLMASGK